MIVTTAAVRNAIAHDHLTINALITLTMGNQVYRITDASNDIRINSVVWQHDICTINAVSLPVSQDELNRDLQEIVILDDSSFTWKNRFENYHKLTMLLEVAFLHNEIYVGNLGVFFGYCNRSNYRIQRSGTRELILTFSSPLAQADGEYLATTSAQNQRLRDPTDTALDQVGVILEFSWGRR